MPRWFFKLMTATNNALFRWSNGRLGSRFFGAPVLLLTVRGRRSGRPLTFPLLYLQDGGDWVVVASKAGDPKHPDWYLNLQVTPEAEIALRDGAVQVRAETVSSDEKAGLWPRLVKMYPAFEGYQRRAATRDIPVVRLRPVG